MNTIVVAGRLTRDAEVKQVGKDQVVQFSVAEDVFVNRQKAAQFFDCSLWGERGAKIAQYLTKGRQVTVTGSLTTREHNGKTYLQVRGSDVALQGGGDGSGKIGGRPVTPEPRAHTDAAEDVRRADTFDDDPGGFGIMGDDLPF